METLKKYWAWVIGAIGAVLGLLYYEKSAKDAAEAKNLILETEVNDAKVEGDKKVVHEQENQELANQEQLKKENEAKKADAGNMSDSEVEQFYKDKLKKDN